MSTFFAFLVSIFSGNKCFDLFIVSSDSCLVSPKRIFHNAPTILAVTLHDIHGYATKFNNSGGASPFFLLEPKYTHIIVPSSIKLFDTIMFPLRTTLVLWTHGGEISTPIDAVRHHRGHRTSSILKGAAI